jgi:hypothetical protein
MSFLCRIVEVLLLVGAAFAAPSHHWGPKQWKALVTFGNSYTDEARLQYFADHKGEAPPVGWEQPVVRSILGLMHRADGMKCTN